MKHTFKLLIFWLLFIYSVPATAFPGPKASDNGTIKGKTVDSKTREPLPFVNIIGLGTSVGTTSDATGSFILKNVKPGYVKLGASSVGYKSFTSADIFVTNEKVPFIEIALEPTTADLKEVVISGPQFVKREESPVSLQTIGIREIERNPGGNRDISRVIQSLPGVASSPSFRNDIVIRGGSPSENKFYLDGMEVPIINHFQTQGSTGGPVGIINVDLVREVDFYSGAFPVNKGNTLSSIMEFKLLEGNQEKTGFRGTIGSSDLGFTIDGPITSKTNYIVSVRRSYLQFLFEALKLPFLPTYTDLQFKVRHKINERNEIIFLGIGAYDQFKLNTNVNDNVDDAEQLEYNNYLLGNIPTNNQWNYSTGAIYKHFGKNSLTNVVLSRSTLNNSSEKFRNNNENVTADQIFDYESEETENKFRVENNFSKGTMKVLSGFSLEYADYLVKGFDNINTSSGPVKRSYNSSLNVFKYGLFVSVSKPVFKNRLALAIGIRTDATDYSAQMNNPAQQLSPRFSASWSFDEKWSWNFNTGRYYQLPSYSILGFSDASGNLINKANKLKYIYNDHLVTGIQFLPDASSKITLEGFYKKYKNYPYSLTDSISLANLGSDFGVVGNESVNSSSKGRAYGIELLLQRRSATGIYGIMAYTFVRSEFTGDNANYIPSAWDNKHLLTLTAGKEFGKNWEMGIKWRYVAGRPYTPYDVPATSLKTNWDVRGQGILDYTLLNTERLAAFHQLDLRIDKKWFFDKWSINLYLDLQNVYAFKAENQNIINVRTDSEGKFITDPEDPNRYLIYYIKDESGTVLPSIGVIIDF
ncbi:MAG: TonB-dependent receptor [Bacteroidetes bacterium]|nr:TonB-dependent receptor [Bacteroidota bacterium]